MEKGRRVKWGRVSLLLNMYKKDCLHNILNEMLLALTRNSAHYNRYVCICSNGQRAGLAQEALRGAQAV
jgi:rhodanese-related sulfurtransferase